MHPWTAAQLNSSNIRLLSRKNLGEKLLDRILPLLAVSEELTRFAGLQPVYDGINHLDPVYCRKDEVLRMLEKGQLKKKYRETKFQLKIFRN